MYPRTKALCICLVALAISLGWLQTCIHDEGGQSAFPINYWKAWASGSIQAKVNEEQLQKGFYAFFSVGKLTVEQERILRSAHAKVTTPSGKTYYRWIDLTHAHSNSQEGSSQYEVVVSVATESIVDFSFGILVD